MYNLGLTAAIDPEGTPQVDSGFSPKSYPTDTGGLEPVAGPGAFGDPGLLPIAPPPPDQAPTATPAGVPVVLLPTGEAVEFEGPTHVEFVRDVLPAGLQPIAQANIGLVVGLAFVGALVFSLLRGGRV